MEEEFLLEELLAKSEGKTLEFKENAHSLPKIVQTVIAFANTAGGTLIIGIQDKNKNVIGVENILLDEERIANTIADSITPTLLPNFQFVSWRNKDVLILTVPHSPGPFYLKDKGETGGVYVRLGSTNRIADAAMISEIKRLKDHISFDQLPELKASTDDLDLPLVNRLLSKVDKTCTESSARSLELIADYHERAYPTKGGMLLFGKRRDEFFPDPFLRLIRFKGVTKSDALDHLDVRSPLPIAIDEALAFIRRNTSMKAVFQNVQREDVPEYPHEVVREAVINAVLHADYSTMLSSIQIAIFDDRMEITNPGPLPLGLSLETALSGVSRLRNRVLGRMFKELHLIEQWGSGLARMRDVCLQLGGAAPKFQELDSFFRVTLYPTAALKSTSLWQESVIAYLQQHTRISTIEAAELWNLSNKTARSRLKALCQEGLLTEISKSPFDPYKNFILSKSEKLTK